MDAEKKGRFTYCNVFALMSKMKTIEHEFLNNNTGYEIGANFMHLLNSCW